jgi:hypothetical protein
MKRTKRHLNDSTAYGSARRRGAVAGARAVRELEDRQAGRQHIRLGGGGRVGHPADAAGLHARGEELVVGGHRPGQVAVVGHLAGPAGSAPSLKRERC